MAWGGLVGVLDLIGWLARAARRDDDGRRIELIDEDFGTVVGRRGRRVWKGRTTLVDPDVEAEIVLSGRREPSAASRRRAREAIAAWSEVARGPLVELLAKRSRRGMGDRGPFRDGAPTADLLERFVPQRVWIDARRKPTRLKVKVAELRRAVRLRLPPS